MLAKRIEPLARSWKIRIAEKDLHGVGEYVPTYYDRVTNLEE